MLTDADWNNLVDVFKAQLQEALNDVIGYGQPGPGKGALNVTDDFKIQAGDLYTDGLRAELIHKDPITIIEQTDFPVKESFSSLPDMKNCIIYADVWERPVTSLEDENLRDSALHGADTCTHTQRMLQVKWCPNSLSPENDIPRKGDGKLILKLRESTASGDPCDPCADVIQAEAIAAGNYLFRAEIHNVEEEAGLLKRISLKWSDENGAEQYEAKDKDDLPEEFVKDGYVYEFFSDDSEKHLGVHRADEFTPTRWGIKETYDVPDKAKYVRRWDGYCELEKNGTWKLVGGMDHGVTLTKALASSQEHGAISIGANIQIQLYTFTFKLKFTGSTFVAGDFWQVSVRMNDEAGNELLKDAPPQGILHHYLSLAEVDGGGKVLRLADDPNNRPHHFPSLTDIEAQDVGYATQCGSGLFDADHFNVKLALDRLCELAAEHVAFSPVCRSVGELYHGLPAESTVKAALDKLCEMMAEHIGYDPACRNPGELYHGLPVESTVKEALDKLCEMMAEHIGYDPACRNAGELYQGLPENATVKAALDKLCQMMAEHIGYDPACRAAGELYHGLPANTTIKAALDHLCNINAGHVDYEADVNCDLLHGAGSVQEALDMLCQREVEGITDRIQKVVPYELFVTEEMVGELEKIGDFKYTPGQAIQFHPEMKLYRPAKSYDMEHVGRFLISEVNRRNGDIKEITLVQAGYIEGLSRHATSFLEPGEAIGLQQLVPGTLYYVSLNQVGRLTPSEPYTVSNPIFLAVSDDAGYVLHYRPLMLEAGVQGEIPGISVPPGYTGKAIFIDEAGKVGIGTADPQKALDVAGSAIVRNTLECAGPIISARHDNVNAGYLNLENPSTLRRWHLTMRSGDNDKLQLHHYSGQAWAGPHLNVNTNGHVGIGTSNPQARLHVPSGGIFYGVAVGVDPPEDKIQFPYPYETVGTTGTNWNLRLHSYRGIHLHAANKQGNTGQAYLTEQGLFYCNLAGGPGDYAEYFESRDGKAIPLGSSVVFEGGKIRKARKGEAPFGVISANPMIRGSLPDEWPQKYLRDKFGNEITEDYEVEIMAPKVDNVKKERQKIKKKKINEEVTRTEVVLKGKKYRQVEVTETVTREVEEPVIKEVDLYDEKGKNVIGKHKIPVMETYIEETQVRDENGQPVMEGTGKFETGKFEKKKRPKLNPKYNEKKEYIRRDKRPEWNCVGLLGQLRIRKGQPTAPTWVKIKNISKDVELWLVK